MRRTLSRVALLVLLAVGVAGHASNALAAWCADPINPPPDPPEEPDPRCEPPCKCTGSPCYLGLGAYTVTETDLHVKTAGGFPLVATRRYVSTRVSDGPMGIGWLPSVISRLSYTTFQLSGGVYQKRAYVLLPDGLRLKFTENTNGTFSPMPGRFDTLIKNADGTFDVTLQHSLSRIHFALTGNATAIWDDYGNLLSITNAGPGGKPSRITDFAGSGRYLSITWGADGRIATIGDSSGRLVQYFYDANGALSSVTNPLGQTTYYDYDAGRFGPLLAQTTDHWGRVVAEAEYEPNTDRVVSYTDDGELYTLTPYPFGPHGVRKHPESLPADQFWTYLFDTDSGLITDIWDTVAWEHREYYPEGTAHDGLLKELVDRVNIHTFYTYDASGRIASVTRNKNAQNTNSVRFDYALRPAVSIQGEVDRSQKTRRRDARYELAHLELRLLPARVEPVASGRSLQGAPQRDGDGPGNIHLRYAWSGHPLHARCGGGRPTMPTTPRATSSP